MCGQVSFDWSHFLRVAVFLHPQSLICWCLVRLSPVVNLRIVRTHIPPPHNHKTPEGREVAYRSKYRYLVSSEYSWRCFARKGCPLTLAPAFSALWFKGPINRPATHRMLTLAISPHRNKSDVSAPAAPHFVRRRGREWLLRKHPIAAEILSMWEFNHISPLFWPVAHTRPF